MSVASTDRRKFVAGALALGASGAVGGLNARQSVAEMTSAGESAGQGEKSFTLKEKATQALSLDVLYDSSIAATSLTGEAADRVAIRRLIDGWAHCADRRLAAKQAALFTVDGTVENYQSLPQGAHAGETTNSSPSSMLRGRAEIETALAVLKKFEKTTHFNGQSEVSIHGDHAVGESYCVAHQLSVEGGKRKHEVLSIRYQDKFVKQDGRWLFQERKLILDWTDTRLFDI